MDWITELSHHFDNIEFFPPIFEEGIKKVEDELGYSLPDELRELYKQTNGFLANYGANICWSLTPMDENSQIISENLHLRESAEGPESVDLDEILFFGDDGADIYWGYILENGKPTDKLVAWNRVKNSVREYQMPLLNFFRMVAEY